MLFLKCFFSYSSSLRAVVRFVKCYAGAGYLYRYKRIEGKTLTSDTPGVCYAGLSTLEKSALCRDGGIMIYLAFARILKTISVWHSTPLNVKGKCAA